MKTVEDFEICLSIQRALLDAVTPSLRRVSFIKSENLITLYFFYDGKISEIEEELVGDVSAEVVSDFPKHNIDCKIILVECPQKISSEERGKEPERPHSGKFNLRMPPDLYVKVTAHAAQEGLSINSYILRKLSA